MTDSTTPSPDNAPLNPALKSQTERVYDTTHTTPAPIDTASASAGDGQGWPWIWLVVTVACVLIAVWLLV